MKSIFNALRDFLAALGMVTVAGLVGLYSSGFFVWAAQKFPANTLFQVVGS